MTASREDLQMLADEMLDLLGVPIRAGQLVVHFKDGLVQRCETHNVHRPSGNRPAAHGLPDRARAQIR
jgi:hypothetical protein